MTSEQVDVQQAAMIKERSTLERNGSKFVRTATQLPSLEIPLGVGRSTSYLCSYVPSSSRRRSNAILKPV